MTIIIIIGYFIPTIVAISKKKKNAGAIVAVNILLGWTLICWLWALIWSLMND